jgi:hypothetical protein
LVQERLSDFGREGWENAMSLTSATVLAATLSFVLFAIMAVWYVAPWLQSRPRIEALIPLVWINAFRHVALQIFSAQHFGFVVSDGTRDQIVTGDLIGMILAAAAIIALHYRSRVAPLLVWGLVAETAVDLAYTTILGVREHLYATVSAVTFLIVAFYVPLLWMSVALMAWQLYSRRREPLAC